MCGAAIKKSHVFAFTSNFHAKMHEKSPKSPKSSHDLYGASANLTKSPGGRLENKDGDFARVHKRVIFENTPKAKQSVKSHKTT
jgi:hypothetical protein